MFHDVCQLAMEYIQLVNENPPRELQPLKQQLGRLLQNLQTAARTNYLGTGSPLTTSPANSPSETPDELDYDGVSEN